MFPDTSLPTPQAIERLRRWGTKQRLRGGHPLADYESAALEALAKAIAAFDPSLGVKFSTYAFWKIRGALVEEKRRWDHVPRSRRAALRDGAEPAATDEPPASLDGTLRMKGKPVFLRNVLADARPTPEEWLLRAEVRSYLRLLPIRERRLMAHLYFDGWTFGKAGADIGVSESRAHQLHDQALVRLREALT